jgi:hypothetical protein
MNIIKQNIRQGILSQYQQSAHSTSLPMAEEHILAAQILERLQLHLQRPYPNPDEDVCDCNDRWETPCPACRDYAKRRYPLIPFEGEI